MPPLGAPGARNALVLLILLVALAASCDEDPPVRGLSRVTPAPARRGAAPALPRISGRLEDLVAGMRVVRTSALRLHEPTLAEMRQARLALRALLANRPGEARLGFLQLGLSLRELREPGASFYVIQEREDQPVRGWGFYAIRHQPRRPLVVEAPHPQHDLHTDDQSAEIAVKLGARALLVSTLHRCASPRPSACQGLTTACRPPRRRGRYRRSDLAHVTRSIFHALHTELTEAEPALVAIQLHGFARRPGRPLHIVLSDGTNLPGGEGSISNGIARLIRSKAPRGGRRWIRSCNERDNTAVLCGTDNVQGRQVNGVSDPCREAATRAANRFLHVEQSLDARLPGQRLEPDLLVEALAEFFPPR